MKLWFLTLTGAFAPCVSAWGGPVTYTYTGQVISTFIPVIFQVPTEVTIEAIGGGGGNSPAYSQDGTLNGITPGGAGADVSATFTFPNGFDADEPVSIWVGGQGGTPQYHFNQTLLICNKAPGGWGAVTGGTGSSQSASGGCSGGGGGASAVAFMDFGLMLMAGGGGGAGGPEGLFVENSFNDYLANTAGVGGSYGVVGGLGGNGSGDPGLNAPGGCGACETDPSAANGSTPSTDTASGGGGGGGGGGCCDVIGPEAFPLYGEGGLAGLVGGGGGGGAGASVVSQVLQTADISYQTAPTVGDGEVIITVTYLPGTLVPVPEPPLLSLLGFSALALSACAMLPCAKRPTAG